MVHRKMEIAIVAGFPAEGYVQIDSGHIALIDSVDLDYL